MLAKILNGKIVEFISEVDSAFPDSPLERRFSKEFLKDCVECPKGVEIGYTYSDGKFEPPVVDPEDIDVPIKDADPTVRQEIETIKATLKTISGLVSKFLNSTGGDK